MRNFTQVLPWNLREMHTFTPGKQNRTFGKKLPKVLYVSVRTVDELKYFLTSRPA